MAVSGTAAVGTGTIVKDTTVVYVVDRSGSMAESAGVNCDGSPGDETRLECVQRAIEQANTAAAAANSSVDLTGLASFAGNGSGTAHDVNLGSGGVQLLVAPGHDGNGNSNPDLEDVADGLSAAGATCYSCGLQAAKTILTSPANTNPVNIVIFLSDGFNNDGPPVSSVTGFPSGTIIRAFALGSASDVTCSDSAPLGNLNDVAALTPGGTCTQTPNFADVGNVITQAIGSTLTSVSLSVDANPVAITTAVALPAAGPVSTTWQASSPLTGLTAGFHTLVATARGSDAGGAGSISDTHTILVNTPPDCSAAAASTRLLWPPNHKYVQEKIVGVTDADGDPVTVAILAITSDEPVDVGGGGDGNTTPDAVIGSKNRFSVRSERQGAADGRVYRVEFSAADNKGGSCSATATVGVPHDQGKHSSPIDSRPPSYDATATH
ncbi:MAG TPA: vWA domain-containing protein [Gaiellaceae bacterium]|nr:vWA domain-containing protein [Gaiellaceae bacterium]